MQLRREEVLVLQPQEVRLKRKGQGTCGAVTHGMALVIMGQGIRRSGPRKVYAASRKAQTNSQYRSTKLTACGQEM